MTVFNSSAASWAIYCTHTLVYMHMHARVRVQKQQNKTKNQAISHITLCMSHNKHLKAEENWKKCVFGLNLNLVQTISIIVCGIPLNLVFVPFEWDMS